MLLPTTASSSSRMYLGSHLMCGKIQIPDPAKYFIVLAESNERWHDTRFTVRERCTNRALHGSQRPLNQLLGPKQPWKANADSCDTASRKTHPIFLVLLRLVQWVVGGACQNLRYQHTNDRSVSLIAILWGSQSPVFRQKGLEYGGIPSSVVAHELHR